jgi:starch synthase (maltosyl-transferring)
VGVRTFRVDNPYTKPFPFWEWVMGEVQGERPDVVFLSEAFTRPKVMKALAKPGLPSLTSTPRGATTSRS